MTTPRGPGAPEAPRHESTEGGSKSTGKAKRAASTASEEASRVTDVAKEQAQEVATEVKTQARDLVGELKTQVRDQSVSQRDRIAQTLRQFGDDLDEMNRSTTSSGLASDIAGQAASKAREFSTFLTEREPGDLIEQIREFARRRPGTFLTGAAIAGVVAGRLTRGAVASNSMGTSAGLSGSYQASQPRPATLRPPTTPEDPTVGRAAETRWNAGNPPTERPDSAVSSVGTSGQVPPDEPLISGQGRP